MKKQTIRSDKGFTLIEIVIALSILLILSSISFVGYQRFLGKARASVCTSNVKAIKKAVDLYIMENDALPAILGDLELEHLKKAYAQVMEESDWQTRFARFFVEINTPSLAHAQFLSVENLGSYGATASFFRCPSSSNPISYGINGDLAGSDLTGADQKEILIGDSDTAIFFGVEQLTHRHHGHTTAIGITSNGVLIESVNGILIDDGNRGHGNDPDGVDPDNPGKSN